MYPHINGTIVVQRVTYLKYEDMGPLKTLFQELTPEIKSVSHERVSSLIRSCGGNITLFLGLDEAVGGKIVGMASLLELNRLRETCGLVEDVAVTPKYRRRGIGRSLMNSIIETGKARHYGSLNLGSVPKSKEAQKFCTSLGFKPRETSDWHVVLS